MTLVKMVIGCPKMLFNNKLTKLRIPSFLRDRSDYSNNLRVPPATALCTRRAGPVQDNGHPERRQAGYACNCARKAPSFAVALNCGTRSSSLKALVNAFERASHRPGRKFPYCGRKCSRSTGDGSGRSSLGNSTTWNGLQIITCGIHILWHFERIPNPANVRREP